MPVGFSLLEVLLVLALLGVVAGMVLPSIQPAVGDQLRSTARIVAGDIQRCRDLAVSRSSRYQWTFELASQRYYLEHTGTNPALDNLPASPFASTGSTSSREIINLADLPYIGPSVRLFKVQSIGSSINDVTTLEIGPLGGTTRADPTRIWLTCGAGAQQLYIPLEVDPVTGLTDIGELQSASP